MLNYERLSEEISAKIKSDRDNGCLPDTAFNEDKVIRRNCDIDKATIIRTAFIRDIDKIIHCPFYNRYADKTQVFSFYKNDDITRRGLHVQLVSRIARTIGKALGLNLDLIEAIALGHDIGHTPFGHAGEEFLDELLYSHTGRHFSHNIHSVRVLDKIFPYNVSLQTLSGIAAHDGEMELSEYYPQPLDNFEDFDRQIEACYLDKKNVRKLVPTTLEGCVMRISDIIAYLGKDRQDAEKADLLKTDAYENCAIGTYNAEIINNLIVNIVENSYGRPYIKMDARHFNALKKAKADNYELIYKNYLVKTEIEDTVKPMMGEMYEKLLSDLINGNTDSPIFSHHINYVNKAHYKRDIPYEQTEPNQIVVDYIASMTDDYFIDLYAHLFPESSLKIVYRGYFE
ncbi:MAG: HD domain-containing protein [Acutalibacteraceae bacterium]|nr:HD domain-containing protein [Acutalibacteraceae bacterium]